MNKKKIIRLPKDSLYWAFLLYAMLSLISMATMSMSVVIFLILLLFDSGGPKSLLQEVQVLIRMPPIRRYLQTSLILVLACFLSLVFEKNFPLYFGKKSVSVSLLKDSAKLWYFFLPLFFVMGWRRLQEHQQKNVLRAWILTFGGISCLGVLQLFTGIPRAIPNEYIPGCYLIVLFFGHHLSVASIWIFPFFSSLDLLYNPSARKTLRLPFWPLAGTVTLGGFCLFFSWSRTLWFAMPFSLLLWVYLRISKRAALISAFIFILIGGILYYTPFIQYRLKSPSGIHDRIELWNANIEFFKNRPWTGVGLGKNQQLSYYFFLEKFPHQSSFFIGHAHNLYLEILAGLGVMGSVAWLAWLWVIGQNLWIIHRRAAPTQFTAGLICAWFTFFMNGLTQVNFWEGKVLHQFMWVTGLVLFWTTQKINSHSYH